MLVQHGEPSCPGFSLGQAQLAAERHWTLRRGSWTRRAFGLAVDDRSRVRTTYVDWLPSGAVLWRSEVLRHCRFDEYFDRYSYLEDLDLSFTARRNWKLAVAADALYNHYPSPARHSSSYSFGRTEVKNRLYFVDKHGLSQPRCWLGLALRMGSTASRACFAATPMLSAACLAT